MAPCSKRPALSLLSCLPAAIQTPRKCSGYRLVAKAAGLWCASNGREVVFQGRLLYVQTLLLSLFSKALSGGEGAGWEFPHEQHPTKWPAPDHSVHPVRSARPGLSPRLGQAWVICPNSLGTRCQAPSQCRERAGLADPVSQWALVGVQPLLVQRRRG